MEGEEDCVRVKKTRVKNSKKVENEEASREVCYKFFN